MVSFSKKAENSCDEQEKRFLPFFLGEKKKKANDFFILLVTLAKRLVNSDRKKIKKLLVVMRVCAVLPPRVRDFSYVAFSLST